MSLLIFTDLDGSLMEHETYSVEPARPVLQILADRGYPLIVNSSKTSVEIRAVQAQLHLDTPYICENGAALHLSDGDVEGTDYIRFGKPRSEWLAAVHKIREQHNLLFKGFADWTVEEIMELTGLDARQAGHAKDRQYSEPISWRDSAKAKVNFENELTELGLQFQEGGQFLSIQSDYDKSDAMRWLQTHHAQATPTITVALGDSPNDQAMLDCADVAVIIKSAKSEQIQLNSATKVIYTQRPGPAGWQDAMEEILELLDSHKLEIK